MRVFLYELTCAPANINEPTFRLLRAEGAAMLAALREDFGRIPGLEVLTLGPDSLSPGIASSSPAHEHQAFRDLARVANFTLVVAPECQDLLLARCGWVEEVQGQLLGPSSSAVRLTADKLALGRHWRACGLATPETILLEPRTPAPSGCFPAILKPRHGAGSQATFLVRRRSDLTACLDQARAEGWEGDLILQPLVHGQPASVAFLTGPGRKVPLLPAAQRLSADGRFHYLGGSLPLPGPLGERAVRLAHRAVDTVVGLRGYVGVDVVLGPAEDGSQDWLIELNPRLTTSYVGLRAVANANLAHALLRIATGEPVQPLSWRPGAVDFQPDGTVEHR